MLRSALIASTFAITATAIVAEPFNFVLLGDMPYGDPADVYAPFETLIDTINARDPELVIHIGDTKSGGTECSDTMLGDQLAYLNAFEAPTIYSIGDNEWTDCHRANAGGFDPIERLDHIRETYFTTPTRSFGKTKAEVETQADAGYPENTRIMMNGIQFIAAHVVGSNNNFEPRNIEAVEEYLARDAANVTWLRDGFERAAAADAVAVVLAIHADMFAVGFDPSFRSEGFVRQSGFASFAGALKEEANGFGKPVLLVYGDSHVFRMFRPFSNTAPGVMALETFGASDMHAVEVKVTPDDAFPFAVQPLFNPDIPIEPAG